MGNYLLSKKNAEVAKQTFHYFKCRKCLRTFKTRLNANSDGCPYCRI